MQFGEKWLDIHNQEEMETEYKNQITTLQVQNESLKRVALNLLEGIKKAGGTVEPFTENKIRFTFKFLKDEFIVNSDLWSNSRLIELIKICNKEEKMMKCYKVIKADNTRCYVSIFKNKEDGTYSFINLTKGHICKCRFNSVEAALADMDDRISKGLIKKYSEEMDYHFEFSTSKAFQYMYNGMPVLDYFKEGFSLDTNVWDRFLDYYKFIGFINPEDMPNVELYFNHRGCIQFEKKIIPVFSDYFDTDKIKLVETELYIDDTVSSIGAYYIGVEKGNYHEID